MHHRPPEDTASQADTPAFRVHTSSVLAVAVDGHAAVVQADSYAASVFHAHTSSADAHAGNIHTPGDYPGAQTAGFRMGYLAAEIHVGA